MGVQVRLQDSLFISFGCIPKNGIAESYSICVFTVLKNFILLYIMTTPVYIPTKTALWFFFLHIFAKCLFDKTILTVWGDISLWCVFFSLKFFLGFCILVFIHFWVIFCIWCKVWSVVLWPLLSFPNLLAYWVQHFHSIIFQDLK